MIMSSFAAGSASPRKRQRVILTREKALEDIKKDWKIVKNLRKKDAPYMVFLKDKEFVKEIIGLNVMMLRYLKDFQDDPEIVFDAVNAVNRETGVVTIRPTAFGYASNRLKRDLEFVKSLRTAVSSDINSKRALKTIDSYLPADVMKKIEPVSAYWLDKAVKDGDYVEFLKQQSILPTRREPFMKLIFKVPGHRITMVGDGLSSASSFSKIFAELSEGEYGQRSLVRGLKVPSFRDSLAEWLSRYASPDLFNDITVRLRHVADFIYTVAKFIGFQLGKPMSEEQLTSFSNKLQYITFGVPNLTSKVYDRLIVSISKFSSAIRLDFDDSSSNSSSTVDFDQRLTKLFTKLIETTPGHMLNLSEFLYRACQYDFIKTARFLIQKNASVNYTPGFTPMLSIAVHNNNEEMVKLLLDNGADVDSKSTDNGQTALMIAKTPSIVNFLIQNGANLNIQDARGYTAIHLAVDHNWISKIQELARRGADLNIPNIYGRTVAFKAVNTLNVNACRIIFNPVYNLDINHTDTNNWNTVTHCLAQMNEGNIEKKKIILALILARSPDVNIPNQRGRTPLSYSKGGELFKMLVEKGAGGKWTLDVFRKIPADSFSTSTVVLKNKEDTMMYNDEVDVPVRCFPCKHEYSAPFLHHWVNENDADLQGYDGYAMGFAPKLKSQCPECRAKIDFVKLFSAEEAEHWDEWEKKAKMEEKKLDDDLKQFEARPEYRQLTVDIEKARQALKEAEEKLQAEDEERKKIRAASDAKQKEYRDKRIVEILNKLKF